MTFLGFRPLLDLYRLGTISDVMLSYYSTLDPLAADNRVPAKYSLYRCAGKPIVAPDLPGIREVLTDEEAVFVTPDCPEALAAAIRQLLDDPQVMQSKGTSALRHAREASITRFCEELAAFFESVTRSTPGRS